MSTLENFGRRASNISKVFIKKNYVPYIKKNYNKEISIYILLWQRLLLSTHIWSIDFLTHFIHCSWFFKHLAEELLILRLLLIDGVNELFEETCFDSNIAKNLIIENKMSKYSQSWAITPLQVSVNGKSK